MCNRLQVALAACILVLTAHLWATARSAPPPQLFAPVASVTHLMHYAIAPRADRLFDAVAVEVNASGERVRAPRGDAEWERLRGDALMLIESANLLHIPGRRVAAVHPDAPVPAAPHLRVRQLQRIVDLDRERWRRYVHALADAASWALDAVETRNVWQLQANAGDIALACERCHLAYWYPGRDVLVAVPDE
jgi:hypothetical protein